jgi:hypothetical protein
MKTLNAHEIESVAGGSAYEDGRTFGKTLGLMYWGARDYLSGTVYPYWLD